MSERIIAIGDVHGCARALQTTIDAVAPTADDTLVMLGDCVDRGPDSRGVIELLLKLRDSCQLITLLGNHEEMMLNFIDQRPQPDDWLFCGGAETLDSYGVDTDLSNIPEDHVTFIRGWCDFWETDTHFFAHGNYDPDQPFTSQRWQSQRWISLREYIPDPHFSGKTAVVGHTSQKHAEIFDLGYLVCIDTYCHGGGWLTALDVTTGRVWQANDAGDLRSERT